MFLDEQSKIMTDHDVKRFMLVLAVCFVQQWNKTYQPKLVIDFKYKFLKDLIQNRIQISA